MFPKKNLYYTYVIRSECGKFYIGHTEDIEKRIQQHNSGISKWTSKYKNWKLVHSEEFLTRKEANQRELHLKKQKGGDIFLRIIGESKGSSGS